LASCQPPNAENSHLPVVVFIFWLVQKKEVATRATLMAMPAAFLFHD
jgi:hypothetical protein